MVRRWETDSRYYCVRVYRDLFGTLIVAKAWGGKRNSLGNVKIEPVPDFSGANALLNALVKRRAQRRYRLTSSTSGRHARP